MQIFSNNQTRRTETITAQSARVLWSVGNSAPNTVPLYMLQVNIRYAQTITPVYPLYSFDNGNVKLLIKGAPEGTLTCQGLVVKNIGSLQSFLQAASKSCKTADDEVKLTLYPFGNGCTTDPGDAAHSYTISGVDLSQFDLNLQAGQVASITHTLTFTFTDLQLN